MKKYAVSLVVVLLALSLCACGTGRKEKEQSSAGVSEVEQGSSLMKEEVQSNAGVTDEEKRSEEVTEAEQSSDNEEEFFTETLARIYIKQGRYQKALDIIQRLSTQFPGKNAYFADQIRFLEKLIINSNKNKK